MKEVDDFLTTEEWEKFYNAISDLKRVWTGKKWGKAYTTFTPDDMKAFFRLLYGCALTESDALALQTDDFDLKNKRIKIRSTQQEATILPTDIEFFEGFIHSKGEGKMFEFVRATTWRYAKNIGELANLKIFKKTKEREMGGAITKIFRNSMRRHMEDLRARSELIALKLRNYSGNEYGGLDLSDLQVWEERHYYIRSRGVVVILDALGIKGSWRENSPADLVKNWEDLTLKIKTVLENESIESGSKFEIYAFSDTFIITAKGNSIEKLLLQVAKILKFLFYNGITHNLYFRGCMSVGPIFELGSMVIGPTVDEAAQYYETPNWLGISATPSAYSALQRMEENSGLKEKLDEFFTKYDIPLKNGLDRQGWALRIDPEQSLQGWTKGDKESNKTLKDFVHDQLENSMGLEIGQKWKNTLEYLSFLKK